MTDRPIIFSAPMVRALLGGRKTMTRRMAWRVSMRPGGPILDGANGQMDIVETHQVHEPSPWLKVQPGDRLWVRENFWHAPAEMGFDRTHGMHGHVAYSAGPGMGADAEDRARAYGVKQRPSRHMPRRFSRLTLTVTAVRVERLQDISEADALAEGTREPSLRDLGKDLAQAAWSERQVFKRLWNHLHGPSAWDANPEVVALTFTVRRGNIDA